MSRSPAAAAGSAGVFLADSATGLPEALPTGLLLRLESECLAGGGERDRRSKREERFGSGSVWSNLERFAVLLSVSSILSFGISSNTLLNGGCMVPAHFWIGRGRFEVQRT
jgi:hypothetical protein